MKRNRAGSEPTGRPDGQSVKAYGGLSPLTVGLAVLAAAVVFTATIMWPKSSRQEPTSGTGNGSTDRTQLPHSDVSQATNGSRSQPIDERHIPDVADDTGLSASVLTARAHAEQAALRRQLDPQTDGWYTESLSELAGKQLKRLEQWISETARGAQREAMRKRLTEVVTPNALFTSLRPHDLQVVFESDSIVTRRSADAPPQVELLRGPDGLAEAIERLVRPLSSANDVEAHFKIVGIEPSEKGTVRTKLLFSLGGHAQQGSNVFQSSAEWICDWSAATDNGPLQLEGVRVEHYEESASRGPHSYLFADCTEAVVGHNASYRQQLSFGLNHWLNQIEAAHLIHNFVRTGLAVGDVNGDGRDDVYICQPGGLPNRLFVQQPDGTAADVSPEAGVDWLDHTSSALLVDLDNDGDQDLVTAMRVGLLVHENDGSGHFRQQTLLEAGRDFESLSAADYDNDGDLDLYACAYNSSATADQFVYHDATDAQPNLLFRNDITAGQAGVWRFTDVTESVGLDDDNRRWSLAAAWEDYDNDGDQDLYVANDYGPNCLYRNDQGRFSNVAREAGVLDFGSGMSVSWADYDRDGHMDLYVGNMFSSAGNRIAFQEQFKPDTDEATREIYRRFAKGNSLFKNLGQGRFRDMGSAAGVEMGRWAWSSVFADINNDSWQDIFVANGYITTADSGDL